MALDKITQVTGRGVYVPGSDIDTDRIIPARFMKCVTFDGLGEYLFYDVRYHEDGSKKDHPLDDARFSGASILLSGENFGCGSSREHAPQALNRFGIHAVIAESFAEIFFGNCTTLGMPCVTASSDDIKTLATAVETDPSLDITIDIENGQVTYGDGNSIAITIPATASDALINGRWDPIAELLEASEQVAATVTAAGYQ
ncbi:MAG: 3-isopropylmalate dehydratase small subunit [Verrucomicrobia bacterium]|nr:3-isopropylmalate dehydratase small subunit [Verrucomicrobiota bacterium]